MGHAAPILAIFALVILLHWQLVLNINTHVIGRPFEDAFEVLWQLDWMQRAVFELQTNPFYTPDIYHPVGWHTASAAQPSWYFLLLSPVTYLFGATLTYNLLHLLLLGGIGCGIYLFVNELTDDRWASMVVGLILPSSANIQMRLGGHTHTIIATFFLCFAYLFCYRALLRKNSSNRLIIASGLFLAASILGHWYFLFIATLPMLAFLVAPTAGMVDWSHRLGRLTVIGLIALACIGPFAYLSWSAQSAMFGETAVTSLIASDSTGISFDALFRPQWWHPLWRDAADERLVFLGGESRPVTLGYTAVFLAVCSLFLSQFDKSRLFWGIGVIALIFGLGTSLHWAGQRLEINSSGVLSWLNDWLLYELALPEGRGALPLPGAVFYNYLPFYDGIRVWARFVLPLIWAVSILAGLGLAALRQRMRYGTAILAVCLALVIFEGWLTPYLFFTDVRDNHRPEVNAWLATVPNDAAIIEYPRWIDKIAMYNQGFHQHPIVNGYMSYAPRFLQEAGQAVESSWPTAAAMPFLYEWDVEYLLLSGSDSDAFQNEVLPSIIAIDGLCLTESFVEGAMGFKNSYIFTVVPEGQLCE
ncbi:MAG: hypothetical protein AB8G95_19885 [Anaerolineae bacterium]